MRRPSERANWYCRAVSLLIACGSASASALAADAPPAIPLAPVEVVGTTPVSATGIDRDRLPYTVQTGTAAESRAMQADSLSSYLLRRFTGFNVSDLQGNPLLPEVTFHGYRASSLVGAPQGISVFLDGVRVNEAFGDIVSWDLIPDVALLRMTMVSGSNPAYGLNTLGGALVLTTQSGKSAPGAFVDVRGGSFGLVRADVSWGFGADGPVDGYVAATLFNQDGWRAHSPARLGNLFAKLGGDVHGDRWEVSLLGGASRMIGNAPVPSTRFGGETQQPGLYDADRAAVYTWPDETRNKALQLNGRYSHRLADGSEWTTVAYARGTRRDTVSGDVDETYAGYVESCEGGFLPDGAPADVRCPYARDEGAALPSAVLNTTSTRQTSVGLSTTWAARTDANHVAVGADVLGSKVTYRQHARAGAFTADREAIALPAADSELVAGVDGRTRTAGAYVTDTWTVLPHTFVTGSLRYTWSRVANTLVTPGAEHASETFTYDKLNPALGIAQQFGPVTLFANGSQSNRVPTSVELGCADPSAPCRLPAGLQSDPFLAQVVARTIELGARGAPWGGARASIAWFDTRNRDDILFRRAPDTQNGYFSNFPRTRNRGVDVGLDQQVGPATLHVAYSYLEATYDADGSIVEGERTIQATPGMRLPGLPRHALRASVDWQALPTLTLGADVMANSRIVTAGNEDGLWADPAPGSAPRSADASVGGWTVVNLRASWRPDPRFEIYGTVGNVLGKRYETYGTLGNDLFPGGRLIQPHVDPQDAATARFVAPGAPTSVFVGLRYAAP
jgi:outer membrane receptor protein involved in Fe transport